MIAAVGSVFLLPWTWYSNPTAIHYSLGVLAALIGPLFGILIAGYYIAARQRIKTDEMFTMSEKGAYWYRKGYNPNSIKALLFAGVPTILIAILPKLIADLGGFDVSWIGNFTWFIGCGAGFALFVLFEKLDPRVPSFAGEVEGISDGTVDGADAASAPAVEQPRTVASPR
jgi:NCS1 family nucleobase:cation symporter-1